MSEYARFARFYDAVNNEPESRARKILHYIERYAPTAQSVLELGCGTGAVLAGLGSGYALTGLDRSAEMLAFARRRCPTARFVEGDIAEFSLGGRFDVVICVYDTLNHLTTFARWRDAFDCARSHLNDGGVFILDLNTIGRLHRLGVAPPWVHDFDGNVMIMDVQPEGERLWEWDIRVFEHLGGDAYTMTHEVITELGVPLDEVRSALATDFVLLEESDPDGNVPDDQSARAYFVWRLSERS